MNKLPFEYEELNVLIKQEAETDPSYGKAPEERSIEELLDFSFINLDKPDGPTSFSASCKVRKAVGVKKSGHTGTLDPMVTGSLPVALGRATRLTGLFLAAGKEYKGTMQIHGSVTRKELDAVLEEFLGNIRQLPPVRSRVKRVERVREIYYFEVNSFEKKNVRFTVGCQAGTYIRKLCHDIGERLGTGAHMTALRRSKAGPFAMEDSFNLEQIREAGELYREHSDDSLLKEILIPAEHTLRHIPSVWVTDAWAGEMTYGAHLMSEGICRYHDTIEEGETVMVFTLKGELAAFGPSLLSSGEIGSPENKIMMKDKKVFLAQGSYPRIEK